MPKSGRRLIDFSWVNADLKVQKIDLKKEAKSLIYLLQLYEQGINNIHLLPTLRTFISNYIFSAGKEYILEELLNSNKLKK